MSDGDVIVRTPTPLRGVVGERDYAEMTARPLRRRAASTARPPAVAMRTRNPWVLARLRLFGW
jgi:hypothetical protein